MVEATTRMRCRRKAAPWRDLTAGNFTIWCLTSTFVVMFIHCRCFLGGFLPSLWHWRSVSQICTVTFCRLPSTNESTKCRGRLFITLKRGLLPKARCRRYIPMLECNIWLPTPRHTFLLLLLLLLPLRCVSFRTLWDVAAGSPISLRQKK